MSPALNGNTALQHFERGNVVKIRNGIVFYFYLGLPHTCVSVCLLLDPQYLAFSKCLTSGDAANVKTFLLSAASWMMPSRRVWRVPSGSGTQLYSAVTMYVP